jgi:hypothetical protein
MNLSGQIWDKIKKGSFLADAAPRFQWVPLTTPLDKECGKDKNN